MSEFGAGQTLSGRVLRAMSRRSAQVVGESFRFVHDPGPLDRWLFDRLGERVVAVYEIEGQPRVGPIRVYDRAILADGEAQWAAERYFSGNKWAMVLGNPSTWPPEIQQRRDRPTVSIEARRDDQAFAQQMNRVGPTAPVSMFDGDVLWSLDPALHWFGVRTFEWERGGAYHEKLSLVAFPNAAWTMGMSGQMELIAEFARADASALGRDMIAWEGTQATLQLNNASVFVIERRTRLSDEEYEERYIR